MKTSLFFLFVAFCSTSFAQETVKVNLTGITPAVCEQLKANGDFISWSYVDGSQKLRNNIWIEINNVGVKSGDKGTAAVEATPDAKGIYLFDVSADVKIKKLDKTKPVVIRVRMETSLGNEVFLTAERPFEKISEPMAFDAYMWRADNDKIKPERTLALYFSAFLQDPTLRQKALDHDGPAKFALTDFQLFLKQDEKAEWKPFTDAIAGNLSNGTAVEMKNKLPAWIDPTKKIYVRFSAKTLKGNYIWGEYAAEPHEFRKEVRATGYSGKAFDPSANLN